MEASIPMLPQEASATQYVPLIVGSAVRPKATRGPREVGVVRQVDHDRGLAFVYFYASGHKRWFRADALVPTGERVAPKACAR